MALTLCQYAQVRLKQRLLISSLHPEQSTNEDVARGALVHKINLKAVKAFDPALLLCTPKNENFSKIVFGHLLVCIGHIRV